MNTPTAAVVAQNTAGQLRDAIQESGLTPPDTIIPDGRIHRFPSNGDRSSTDGWYVAYDGEIPAGAYGCWRAGISETWSARRRDDLSPAERAEHDRRIREAKEQAERERQERQAEAAARARKLWDSTEPATADHSYLKAKGVDAHGIRIHGDALVVPMHDQNGELHSLQFIQPDGDKRFLSGGGTVGCHFSIGTPDDCICVAEGYATASSVYEATDQAVAVAFNAGNLKPVAEILRQKFPNIQIVIAGDNDESKTGQEKAQEAAEAVNGRAAIPPELGDWNDYAAAHGLEAVKAGIEISDRDTHSGNSSGTYEEIIRLAGLSALDYEQRRESAAKRLKIRTSVLDKEVEKIRNQTESEAGTSLLFPDIQPWPQPVEGQALLNELRQAIQTHAIMAPEAMDALSLFIVHTYALDAASITPIIALLSPEKRCGKSTALDLIQRLSYRPLLASNITAAAMFRAIEAWNPTFLIDEADTFLRNSDDLRGIINSGNSRSTAFVIRTVGDEHEPQKFTTWGAKVIAMIGNLPDTISDRAIEINLRRKLSNEAVQKLRHADPALFVNLARQCARFADDNLEVLKAQRPQIPDSLNDRAGDCWEPLLAIADVVGGEWPATARQAAMALSGQAQRDDDSIKAMLLADLRDLFESEGTTRLSSTDIVSHLGKIEERPWPEWKRGNPITARQLASLLRPFSIKPKQLWRHGQNERGYELEQFEDAFSRYLGDSSARRLERSTDAGFGDFQSARPDEPLADEKSLKRSAGAGSSELADQKGETPERELF